MSTALTSMALVLFCLLLADIVQIVRRRRRRIFGAELAGIRAACERAARHSPDWYPYN